MRSSATVLILISFFFAKFARAQSNELLIQGATPKLYLEHTVVAKENWYSIGRLYNVNPKELAPYNHTTLAKPLIIGQLLQIPLTAVNYSSTGVKVPGETLVPVIHVTQEKEWMYRISVNHDKVPAANIEKWNHVTPDGIHPGMHLIVGYLKVRTALSSLAANPPAASIAATTPAKPAESATKPAESATKPESFSKTAEAPAKPVETPAKPTGAAATTTNTLPPPATSSPTTAATPPPVAPPASTPVKPVEAPAKSTDATAKTTRPTVATPHFSGGVFKTDFNDGGHSATGQAGVFKSTSGWQDGKYYALMNNATVGTIVKVTDPATGKSVYAKILGQLPEMKESAGLSIRISNAAAAELNQGVETHFNVQINY